MHTAHCAQVRGELYVVYCVMEDVKMTGIGRGATDTISNNQYTCTWSNYAQSTDTKIQHTVYSNVKFLGNLSLQGKGCLSLPFN